MKNLAVILARSGSKRIVDKNIKLLKGKPLLAYSIEAASQSGIFDCIHVSTDSERYANIAKEYGADVPFLRSVSLASDCADSWDAIEEVLERYAEKERCFDMVTLLQPTSPLRKAEDIIQAYSMFQRPEVKAVVSVCEMEHSPLWSNILPKDYSMENFQRSESLKLRQNTDIYYRINGAIYMIERRFLQQDHKIYRKGCYAYIMSRERSVDIDTQLDFRVAEFLLGGVN